MSSKRIPRKNLATVGGRTLLDLAIDRFEAWFPDAIRWVATEDDEARKLAIRRGCQVIPLADADVRDNRIASEPFSEWLLRRGSFERCMLYQLTSPFTFRSELVAAVHSGRPCCAGWLGKLHFCNDGKSFSGLSQTLPVSAFLTGNFYVCNGGREWVAADESAESLIPVSWLSSINIDTPEDLRMADFIASRVTLWDFDDLSTASVA